MTTIEFIAIFVSIVVGLAMAEVIQGFADALRHRNSVLIYWPLLVFAAIVLIMAIWTVRWLWLAEDQATWTWGDLSLTLMLGLLIFMMARLTFPQELEGCDLKKYYFEHSRVIWSLAAMFVAVAGLRVATLEVGVTEGVTDLPAWILRFIAFLLCVVLTVSKRERLHEIGLGIAMVLMIARFATSYVAFGG